MLLGGGPIYQEGGIGKEGDFEAPKAPQFFFTFLKIFGKFVNKNAIKMISGVLLVDTIQKFRKNTDLWEKNTSTNGQKF